MREGYDVAQICLNGHLITDFAASQTQHRKAYCDKCGEPTMMECGNCKKAIDGYYHSPGVCGYYEYNIPRFCHNCGKAFPWTSRGIEAANQLASDDGTLSVEEKEQFAKDIQEITRESPQAPASAGRLQKMIGKMTAETAAAVREIIVKVATEAVVKWIWPS